MAATSTITFDKASYTVGDTITVTVVDSSLLGITESETATYTESDGDKVTQVTTIQHPDVVAGGLISSTARVYTKASQTGATVVYTGKA